MENQLNTNQEWESSLRTLDLCRAKLEANNNKLALLLEQLGGDKQ